MLEGAIRIYVAAVNLLWRAFGIGCVIVGGALALGGVSVAAGVVIALIGIATFWIGPLKVAHIASMFRAFSIQSGTHAGGHSPRAPNKSLERSRDR